MNELLDTYENKIKESAFTSKVLNTILFLLSFVVLVFTLWKVWSSKGTLSSPWLPKYTIYYMNGSLINFTVMLSFGIIPAIIARLLKRYSLSTAIVTAFLIVAFVFRNEVSFYWDIFQLLN